MKLSRLALAVALLPASTLYAVADSSEDALKLSNTVITANRAAEERTDTMAAVTVFTRADIDRLQPVNVPDLLNRVPGVQIVQSGGRGSTTGVFVRGTKTAQTLVLIDGVRVGSVSTGGANGALEHLNLEQIERVEVLRGPHSAMYGSDAIGGVIQIFTRRSAGEGLHGRARLAVGNKGVWERSAGVSGGDQNTRFNLSASLDEMAGFDRTTKGDSLSSDDDTYRNKALSFSLSHAFNEQLRAGVNVLDQRGKTEYDNTFMQKPYTDFTASVVSTFVELQATEQWLSRLELGYSEDKLKGRDKLDSPFSAYDINSYRDSAAWLNTFQLNDEHTLRAGADYLKDKVRTDARTVEDKYTKDSRWNKAAFIQHNYSGDLFGTELGLRHDKNQQFGSENTWNAALSIPVGQTNEFILSYSEGFRAPGLMDLYYPDYCSPVGCMKQSNPNLKAEKSKSYELQWRSQLADTVALEASLYRTNIRNAIAGFPPENINKARINGLEVSLQHELYGADGALNISFIDPRDSESGRQLQRVAKRTLSYDLDKQLGAFAVGGTWMLASDSIDAVSNSITWETERKKIAGFGTLDLRGSWQATHDLGVDLRLANIFDKDYTRALYNYEGDAYGYREDRFTVLLGVTWTPNL
ncbi:TonB-dependent receptor domain-containing protein [Denitrificimonas caeni]|uniref:TonB-dependent receptor n=1 Tax=Denitrificimonas caeni TaxID=521720 RepID=A0AAE9VSV3_9GAMM|nr:TonB-dependent receptor [Denitrificimonas caeni]WBE25199.1 TonB-dependent receptor [Denitrificimonas caeni]